MIECKNNQYLIERKKDQGMSNLQAVGVFWGGVLFLIAFVALLWLPEILNWGV